MCARQVVVCVHKNVPTRCENAWIRGFSEEIGPSGDISFTFYKRDSEAERLVDKYICFYELSILLILFGKRGHFVLAAEFGGAREWQKGGGVRVQHQRKIINIFTQGTEALFLLFLISTIFSAIIVMVYTEAHTCNCSTYPSMCAFSVQGCRSSTQRPGIMDVHIWKSSKQCRALESTFARSNYISITEASLLTQSSAVYARLNLKSHPGRIANWVSGWIGSLPNLTRMKSKSHIHKQNSPGESEL